MRFAQQREPERLRRLRQPQLPPVDRAHDPAVIHPLDRVGDRDDGDGGVGTVGDAVDDRGEQVGRGERSCCVMHDDDVNVVAEHVEGRPHRRLP